MTSSARRGLLVAGLTFLLSGCEAISGLDDFKVIDEQETGDAGTGGSAGTGEAGFFGSGGRTAAGGGVSTGGSAAAGGESAGGAAGGTSGAAGEPAFAGAAGTAGTAGSAGVLSGAGGTAGSTGAGGEPGFAGAAGRGGAAGGFNPGGAGGVGPAGGGGFGEAGGVTAEVGGGFGAGAGGIGGASGAAGAGEGGTGGGSVDPQQPVDGACEPGRGLVEATNECWSCAQGVPLPSACADTGETGVVVAAEPATGTECLCETEEGFFIGSSSDSAIECDEDEDGWVKESAQPSIEGEDALRRLNARCTVSYIQQVVLENTDGDQLGVAVASDNPAGLPLYEPDRNDDPDGQIGTYVVQGAGVNGFTKGCSALDDDYNYNGVSDVQETPTSQLRDLGTQLAAYFAEYARFSHFMELHESYLASADTYVIRERSREDFSGWYPQWASLHADHWRRCDRHVDSEHAAGQSGPGGDFADFSLAAGWQSGGATAALHPGMLHHSQFKCVLIDTEQNVGSEDRTIGYVLPVSSPDRVDPIMGTPLIVTGDNRRNRWALSSCTASEGGANGLIFDCPPLGAAEPQVGGVYWAAIGYENASLGDEDYQYLRGCTNGCAEVGIAQCDNNPAGLAESGRWACNYARDDSFGYAICGCGMSYYGGTCEIGCPNAELFVEQTQTQDGPIPNRDGYWMCAHMTASLATPLSGGDYALRGFVPIAGTVGEFTGGGYTLRPAPAGNPVITPGEQAP